MAAYQCICCGNKREAEGSCRCPNCGYKMFRAPYERREALIREIRDFIMKLRITAVSPYDIRLFRTVEHGTSKPEIIPKKADEQRFPILNKIQSYVCSANKTEVFFKRLDDTVEEIRKHLHTPFHMEYTADLDPMKAQIVGYDEVLKQAFEILKIETPMPALDLPRVTLDYEELPDKDLLLIADSIMDQLLQLSKKLLWFIKINNIYGSSYRSAPNSVYPTPENYDYTAALKKVEKSLANTIAKKFTVDIFSDGSEEIAAMLKAIWHGITALLSTPVLTPVSRWIIEGYPDVFAADINDKLIGIIAARYEGIDAAVSDASFLSDKTEDDLFKLYNKMIDIDTFGVMGINKVELTQPGESERQLDEMIGLASIKESIRKIKAYTLSNKDTGSLNIHMAFYGNPGTGKTEVARCIAGILYENKILPTKNVIEVDRSGLVSQYFGATAEKTSRVIASALGGVLFIDEAYALANNSDRDGGAVDYGKEAVDTLVKAMEDHRGEFCVIFAGYKNEMLKMIASNPGLRSRIQFELDFPNYSREELGRLTQLMIDHRGYTITSPTMEKVLDITDVKRKEPNFANAREIRNILDQIIMCQNLRCMGTGDHEIGLVDVNKYITDAKIVLPTSGGESGKHILTGEEELEQLIGLATVKRMVKKIRAYAKRNVHESNFNLHMVFYGNPGTGKTEVARIISRILYDAGVLSEAKLVETDSTGLLGQCVGQTGPKTEKKIQEALGGVLFIDEAYGLVGTNSQTGVSTTYGDEAIAVLLKQMEDRRGQFCAILAGYKDEMKKMLAANPGFESRIQFTLEFPDYTREELGEIAKAFLAKKKYTIDDAALNRLLDITEYYRSRPNFANARTVRNILDQVIMNQNLRAEDNRDDYEIIMDDVEDYIADEGIDMSKPTSGGKKRIGF